MLTFLRINKMQNTSKLFVYTLIIVIFFLNNCYAETDAEMKEHALEYLGATIGQLVTTIGGTFISGSIMAAIYGNNISGEFPGMSGYALLCGICAGTLIGAPTGVIMTGKIMHQNGSVWGAYAGGLFGTMLVLGTMYVNGKSVSLNGVTIPSILILPPICSIWGYNLLGSENSSSSSMFLKYAPQCAVTLRPLENNKRIIPEIGMKLTVKF